MKAVIRVAIADSNHLYRVGVRTILAEHDDLVVSAEATNVKDLEAICSSEPKPHVLIVNLGIAPTSGLTVVQKLTSEHPKMPLIAVGSLCEEVYAARVVRAGGAAYLKADCSPTELVEAIHAVHSGRMYLTTEASLAVVEQLQNRNSQKHLHASLSDREYQIFKMICRGLPLVKIGEEFEISVKTVSTYRARILKKLNMKSNAELVQYAVTNKMLDSVSA